jgi:hypothetical protein
MSEKIALDCVFGRIFSEMHSIYIGVNNIYETSLGGFIERVKEGVYVIEHKSSLLKALYLFYNAVKPNKLRYLNMQFDYNIHKGFTDIFKDREKTEGFIVFDKYQLQLSYKNIPSNRSVLYRTGFFTAKYSIMKTDTYEDWLTYNIESTYYSIEKHYASDDKKVKSFPTVVYVSPFNHILYAHYPKLDIEQVSYNNTGDCEQPSDFFELVNFLSVSNNDIIIIDSFIRKDCENYNEILGYLSYISKENNNTFILGV